MSRFVDAAKTVRNHLRPYNPASVVSLALSELWKGHQAARVDELKSAPWAILLIVKLVLEDLQASFRSSWSCPPEIFHRCRQLIWETSPFEPDDSSGRNIFLSLRSMMYQQILFQQPIDWNFLRWPALIADLQPDHPTRRQFEQVVGTDPDSFAGLAWMLYVPAIRGENAINPDLLQLAQSIYGDAVPRFLALFVRDLAEIRAELRYEFDSRLNAASGGPASRRRLPRVRSQMERNEFPWLSRFPILALSDGRLAIWHPRVLARGIEQSTHRLLSTLGQEYSDEFSKVFESYVVSLIEEVGLTPINDAQFKSLGKASYPAVDAIIEYPSANVFVEAKMSLFADEVLLSDETSLVYGKLKRVREGIVQAWRVGSLIRDGSVTVGNCAAAVEDFLIIVTSRQLFCCTGDHLIRMLGTEVFADMDRGSPHGRPTDDQMRRLPPKNIIIASIEEFEHLMGCVGAKEIDLPSFLREVGDACVDPEKSRLFLDQFLGKKTKKWRMPRVQTELRGRVEARLIAFA